MDFSSTWRVEHLKTKHIYYSLNNTSWKGYPVYFTISNRIFPTILNDYYYVDITVDYIKSILDSRVLKINQLGHTTLLSDKYNIPAKNTGILINLKSINTNKTFSCVVLEQIMDSRDKTANSSSTSLVEYIIALKERSR